jgi:hypothetical protein
MVLIQAQLQLQSGRFGWGGGGSRMRRQRAGGRPVGENLRLAGDRRSLGSVAVRHRCSRPSRHAFLLGSPRPPLASTGTGRARLRRTAGTARAPLCTPICKSSSVSARRSASWPVAAVVRGADRHLLLECHRSSEIQRHGHGVPATTQVHMFLLESARLSVGNDSGSANGQRHDRT